MERVVELGDRVLGNLHCVLRRSFGGSAAAIAAIFGRRLVLCDSDACNQIDRR